MSRAGALGGDLAASDALYYPYIRFWDEGWLKSTALYWDSVSRIVPDGFEPKDSDDVKRLIDAGYIDPEPDRRRPDPDAIDRVSRAMLWLLDEYAFEMVARYGLMNRATWQVTNPHHSSLRFGDFYVPELDPRLDYIAADKTGWPDRNELIDLGLAERISAGGWLGVHPRLGQAYLWALASETAQKRGLRLLADNPEYHTAIMGEPKEALRNFLLRPDKSEGAHPHMDTVMMTVVLRNVRPRDYNNLPVSEILALRQNTDEARCELQLKIQDLVFGESENLQKICNADDLEKRLGNLYDRRLKPSLNRIEEALQVRHRVEWKGALAASFVAPPSVIAAIGHPAARPLLVMCAAGALVVGLWRSQTSVTDIQRQDPVAFYLHQIKDMKEHNVIKTIAEAAEDPAATYTRIQ